MQEPVAPHPPTDAHPGRRPESIPPLTGPWRDLMRGLWLLWAAGLVIGVAYFVELAEGLNFLLLRQNHADGHGWQILRELFAMVTGPMRQWGLPIMGTVLPVAGAFILKRATAVQGVGPAGIVRMLTIIMAGSWMLNWLLRRGGGHAFRTDRPEWVWTIADIAEIAWPAAAVALWGCLAAVALRVGDRIARPTVLRYVWSAAVLGAMPSAVDAMWRVGRRIDPDLFRALQQKIGGDFAMWCDGLCGLSLAAGVALAWGVLRRLSADVRVFVARGAGGGLPAYRVG